jgi:hypothetical protein
MSLNHFSRRFLAPAAAASDGQAHLHFEQRARALIHGFADLAVADGMAHANVHGGRLSNPATLALAATIGHHRKSKCE